MFFICLFSYFLTFVLILIWFKTGADVAGPGGFYLKGDGAGLNTALLSFGLDFLEKKGYECLQTPSF